MQFVTKGKIMKKGVFQSIIIIIGFLFLCACSKNTEFSSQSKIENQQSEVLDVEGKGSQKEEDNIVAEDSESHYWEDDYCESYRYFKEAGDFSLERAKHKSENNIKEEYLIESHQIETDTTIIKVDLYYSEAQKRYYFFRENDKWFVFAIIKQIADDSVYFNKDFDSIVIPDPYCFLSIGGKTGADDVEGYRDEKEYDDNGNLIRYTSYGVVNGFKEYDGENKVLESNYLYNDEGILVRWTQHQNSRIWGTQFQTRSYYCDQKGKPLFLSAYITHGNAEYYYIYEDMEEPQYIIMVDGFIGIVVMYNYPGNQ